MKDILILLIGFVLLIKGSDFFVDGASKLAKLMRIPTLIIGLTIVAMGTSAPELAVSTGAALKGANGIALGNVVGSNIFNLLAVGGIAALIYPIAIENISIKRDFPFSILTSILLLILCKNFFIKTGTYTLSRLDGITLIVVFVIFMGLLIRFATLNKEPEAATDSVEEISLFKSIVFIVLGLAAIIFGGDLVVDSASNLAINFGMSENLVGLTIVSIGTSLPELVVSITAAMKKESDIAIGNILGSNIFNILFILGVSSAIKPIIVSSEIFVDLIIVIIVTIITYLLTIKDKILSKKEGILLIIIYIIYMAYIIIRN